MAFSRGRVTAVETDVLVLWPLFTGLELLSIWRPIVRSLPPSASRSMWAARVVLECGVVSSLSSWLDDKGVG